MWNPTHIQLTVGGCRDLIKKGKSGTNDAYVLIKCGSSKYQTSIRERSVDPMFNEKCEFALKDDPKCIKVKVYHRNFFGADVLLGLLNLSLADTCLNITSNRRDWYRLTQKTMNSRKYIGEIELFLSLGVQSQLSASRPDLSKKVSHPIRSVAKTFGNMLHPKNSSKSTSNSSPSARNERLEMFLRSQSCLDVSVTGGKELIGNRRRMVEQIEEEAATPESEDYKILPEDSLDKSTILLEAEESKNDDVFGTELLAGVPIPVTKKTTLRDLGDMIDSADASDAENSVNGAIPKDDMEEFWKILEETPVFCASQKKVVGSEKARNDNSSQPLTEEQFFDSLLNTASCESKGTQTANGISRKVSVGCQVSLDNICQKCIYYEEKLHERQEDCFPQKQELLNLLNKQKNEITKNEKRIAELEEYIDNMLAKVLEAQPQLLTSGTLLMSERKKPVTPPVYNKDIESFMKRPMKPDDDELPAQNRSYDTFNSVFF